MFLLLGETYMFFHVLNIATVFWYHHAEDGQTTGWNMLANIL